VTAVSEETFLVDYPWDPADLPANMFRKAYTEDDPPVHIPLHELGNFHGIPPLRKSHLQIKPAQQQQQLSIMDQQQSPEQLRQQQQQVMMSMMQMMMGNPGSSSSLSSSSAGPPAGCLQGLQMFSPKARTSQRDEPSDLPSSLSSSSAGPPAGGLQGLQMFSPKARTSQRDDNALSDGPFNLPAMALGKQRDDHAEDDQLNIDIVPGARADSQSKLMLKAMADRDDAKDEAKTKAVNKRPATNMAANVEKKPATKVIAPAKKTLKPWSSVPKKLKTKFKKGCSKCRHVEGCTPSCWKYRGFDA
jgi:hypothetical protein